METDANSVKNLRVKVVSVDIVKYSLRLPQLQSEIVKYFTSHLRQAITAIDPDGIYVNNNDYVKFLASGDGTLIVFLDTIITPDIHFNFASALLKLVNGHNIQPCKSLLCSQNDDRCYKCHKYDVRIGISQGLAVPFKDINHSPNYAGTPLNEASRIMGLAPINQIALSVCVYDEIGDYLPQTSTTQITEHVGNIKHGHYLRFYTFGDRPTYKTNNEIIAPLNKLFNKNSRVETRLSELPKPVEISMTKETETIHKNIETETNKRRLELLNHNKENNIHALLHNLSLHNTPPRLEYYTTDFATIEILRKKAISNNYDLLPKTISTSAVVCCPERKCIILHNRLASKDTYPNCLHTLGGSLKPRTAGQLDFSSYDPNMIVPVMRDILKESGLTIEWRKSIPLWWLHETTTGFMQLLLAGTSVTSDNIDSVEPYWEGRLKLIPFNKLEDAVLLQHEYNAGSDEKSKLKWTPTGLLGILLWLASGAHGAGVNPEFNGKTPSLFYFSLLKKIEEKGIDELLGEPFSKQQA